MPDEIEHLGVFTNHLEILFGEKVYSSLLPIFLSSYPVFFNNFFFLVVVLPCCLVTFGRYLLL